MKFEFSAGGIVFKKVHSASRSTVSSDRIGSGLQIFILISKHSEHHGWVFPKGLIGDNIKSENKEDTAVREVKEETGINAKIIKPLNPVTYWYVWEKEKRKKTVYYFIMEYLSGDFKDRDFEMEEVEWVLKENVDTKLTYKSDKKVWQEAKLSL